MTSNCTCCRQNEASVSCLCAIPPAFLCADCQITHEKDAPRLHKPISLLLSPVARYKELKSAEFLLAKSELEENLNETEVCCQRFSAEIDQLICELLQYRDRVIGEIQSWKRNMTDSLAESSQVVDSFISSQCDLLESPLSQSLYQFSPGNLRLFSYELDTVSFKSRIESLLRVSFSSSSVHLPAISVAPQTVMQFSPSAHSWSSLMSLSSTIPATDDSNFLFLGANRVFVCCGVRLGSNSNFILDHGLVWESPLLLVNRYHQGLFYDCARDALYVFGGDTEGNDPLKSCECFHPRKWAWEIAGNMTTERRLFNPCLHSGFLYLCGGSTTSIERFSLSTREFTLLPSLSLQSDNVIGVCTTACSTEGKLVVISSRFLCSFQTETGEAQKVMHEHYGTYSHCPPALYGSTLYVVYGNMCRGISVQSGEKLLEVTGFNSR